MGYSYHVWFSDTHGGLELGLLNPNTQLVKVDAEGNQTWYTPAFTPVQEVLWKLYEEQMQAVRDICGPRDRIIVSHGGDIAHGLSHPEELMTTSAYNQALISVDIMEPWFALPNVTTVRILAGTAAHNLGEGSIEYEAAWVLQERHPQCSVKAQMHGRWNIDGVIIDSAHHGPGPGIREWTDGNQLRYYTKSLVLADIRHQIEPPDMIFRAHTHDFTWETIHYQHNGRIRTTHAFISPTFCGMNYYAHRVSKSQSRQDFGMILSQIDDGEVSRIWPLVMTVDLRTKEVL